MLNISLLCLALCTGLSVDLTFLKIDLWITRPQIRQLLAFQKALVDLIQLSCSFFDTSAKLFFDDSAMATPQLFVLQLVEKPSQAIHPISLPPPQNQTWLTISRMDIII